MFKTIVVGIDGSEISDNALRVACELAQKFAAEIHLIHVPQPQTVAFAMGALTGYHTATSMPTSDEVKTAGNKILDAGKAIAKTGGVDIAQAHLKSGDPANQITEYAEACEADLIVTGRRGLGSLGALIQGSTSQAVNHKAKCACLSVT
ncbi:universal stress protein [Roseovarius sp. EL26]|uniref:universal stress protein n=1 Tax=Roseovarius sp. EL26 TaxID=2126672 RepID=UPI000EA2798A|nr:universal stress protein [Roseovarius sp. EL26]